MNHFLILWIFIAAVALIIDIFTSNFFFVWFTIGAIAAIFTQILGYSIIIQSIIFLIISILSIAIGYPLVRKNIKATIKPTLLREQTYIGRKITVDDDMLNNNVVKIDGVLWQIYNIGDNISKGDKVKIVKLKGNKILIEKINEEGI